MTQSTDTSETPIAHDDFVARVELATQKLRDVVKGNGFHPLQDVELIAYEETYLEFPAENSFTLHTDQGEKLVNSIPTNIIKVKNDAQLKECINVDLQKTSTNNPQLTQFKELILKREDKGFFWDKQRTPLSKEPLSYAREEPCQICRGKKQMECTDCHGKGWARCPTCQGRNFSACKQCHGKGEIPCIKCKSKGKRDCSKCRGYGVLTYLTQIKLSADSHFTIDTRDVPDVAKVVLDRLKEKLITKQHATVQVTDDIEKQEKSNHDAILTLDYTISLPLGHAQYRIGEETVSAVLFGYKSALLNVPPFLERYMLAPFNLLREAASNQGNIPQKIQTAAIQTRLSHDVILGVLKDGVNKTEQKLKHDYSIALEPDFIQNFVRTARKALDHLTAKPRLWGMGLGLLPAFLLSLTYIFSLDSGGAGTALPMRLILDLICLGAAVILPYFSAQIMTRQMLVDTLGQSIKKNLQLPKLGRQGYWGSGIAGAIFLVFAEMAFRNNPETAPQIYSLIRGLLPW